MRAPASAEIAFSSTGSVYGEPEVFPTPEDAPFPVQTSLYAASKLAGEGLIGAYAARLRLHRPDLPLRLDPRRALHARARLRLLRALQARPRRACACSATATRRSPTSTCSDCVERDPDRAAAHHARPASAHVYNLGTDETIVVDDSIAIITDHLGLTPEIEHTGGRRGWAGDSPLIRLDTTRIRRLGWARR